MSSAETLNKSKATPIATDNTSNANSSRNKFAQNQLKKYGWKEGDGIGKTNQGIVQPIKASLKFDQSGVGFNRSDEFTVNWWEHLFNSAANKIKETSSSSSPQIVETPKTTKTKEIEIKDVDDDRLKTNGNPLNKKSFYYSRFTKSSLLVDGKMLQTTNENENQTPKEELKEITAKVTTTTTTTTTTDEELFKMCKGRTAHKGARHGIKMNGKLARIEEQEEKMSLLLKQQQQQHQNEVETTHQSDKIKKKKKKRKTHYENEEKELDDSEILLEEKTSKKSKKTKKNIIE